MVKNIVKELIPPIFYKRNKIQKLKEHIYFELYKLSKNKNRLQLFYEELIKQIQELNDINRLFPEEKVKTHYVYEPIRQTIENPDVYITQIRYYKMYSFFKTIYQNIFNDTTKVLDVGDSDGILLKALGKKGTSLNIHKDCVDYIRNLGIEAVIGNAENLEFGDLSFDYVFCFQTIEHCFNPIKILNELGRVAKYNVFLSIPYVDDTRIYEKKYWENIKKESWNIYEVKDSDCHIFEFSTNDLRKLLSYTNLEYENSFRIQYFDEESFKKKLLNKWYPSYFNFFVLKPIRNGKS